MSLNPKTVHCRLSAVEIIEVLKSFTQHPGHRFWEDGALQTEAPIWQRVTGHHQVTDANLLLIAGRHGGKLATLDGAIKNRLPQTEHARVEMIP